MIIVWLDIDKAYLKGLTYSELAAATGEKERMACVALPPGSASVPRSLLGFESCDEARRCLQRLKPGAGSKDAPRAFSLKLRTITRGIGLQPASYDEEFETSASLLTAKYVDDINVACTEAQIYTYVTCVENTFGACKLN